MALGEGISNDFARGACILAIGLAACTKSPPAGEASADEKPGAAAPAGSQPAATSLPSAEPVACFPAFDMGGTPQALEVVGVPFERRGSVLTAKKKDDDAVTRLGVIGNVKEFSEENQKAIGEYVGFFKKQEVEAVVVTGDIGETKDDIREALKAIAQAGVPVFATIGNREDALAFAAAVEDLAKEGVGVVSLGEIRLVQLDDHALVSVPGYHDPSYVHAENGCVYTAKDLAEVEKAIDAAGATPTILVSHGPPAQSGKSGIDVVSEGDHVGDPSLAALVEKKGIRFVLSSNIQEAGGRATNRDGSRVVPPNTKSEELFLNPGGADRAVPWKMSSGKFAYGMVAVGVYEGGAASYEIFELPDTTE